MNILLKCNISFIPQFKHFPRQTMLILSFLFSLYLGVVYTCHTTEIQYNWSLGTRDTFKTELTDFKYFNNALIN